MMPPATPPSLGAIWFTSLRLGLISFGGPTAHLGYFREEFVRRRQWLTDADYADIVALSQFLPGPASSQTIFAIGMRFGGWPGGLLASLGFTLPSALVMGLLAYGMLGWGALDDAGWLRGLQLAAVAVVAKAVVEMAGRLCPDAVRRGIAITVAAVLVMVVHPGLQLLSILAGALVTWKIGHAPSGEPAITHSHPSGQRGAIASLAAFAVLLVLLPMLAPLGREAAVFDSFYRSGAMVFGGGHVVLPLLQAEVIPPGWVREDAFLAGYGAAQAVPGPLFTFAAYLGTLACGGAQAWIGGGLALTAIFLPGWLLIAGSIPFWETLRGKPSARAMLSGANASVVGILAAALYHPVATGSIHDPADGLHAAACFALLMWTKCPPWLLVMASAAVAQWITG